MFLWSYAIGAPFAGFLADRFSRSRIIALSLAGWSAATVLAALAHSFYTLAGARLLLGLTECFYVPAAIALIADHHDQKTRGTALALNLSGMSVGLVVAASLTGLIAERSGWRVPFWILGGTGLIMAALSWVWLRDAKDQIVPEATDPHSLREKLAALFAIKTYLLIVSETMLTSAGVWMFWTWLPLFYHETFHASLATSGFSASFMLQAPAGAGILLGGYFSDRFGRSNPSRRMLILTICYFTSVPFLLVFHGVANFTLISACVFTFSLIRSVGQANEDPILCELLLPRLRSTGYGLLLTANVVAGGIAVLFAGFVKGSYGLGFAFLCISGLILSSALLILLAYLAYFPRDLARAVQRNATQT